MSWYLILAAFVTTLGAFTLSYRIYKMTELDAKCRGLKHPKLWGAFSLSGNNGSEGLILYLIRRQKYPAAINEHHHAEMEAHKRKAVVSLVFLAVGTIALFSILILKY